MMRTMIDTMMTRVSVRAYSSQTVEEEIKKQLLDYLNSIGSGPFGGTVRFALVEIPDGNSEELKRLGSYNQIRGATLYLAGAIKKSEWAMEDFGYCMEAAILKATELGLGSCWLGATLSRSTFASKIGLHRDEIIPAVSPLGYPGGKLAPMVELRGMGKGNRKRMDFHKLFFEDGLDSPLEAGKAKKYQTVLECVRLAPSASNKQPWRIIKEREGNVFHLYLSENKIYNHLIRGVHLQNIDMGIAMLHFEFAVQGIDLKGSWVVKEPPQDRGNLVYIASWMGETD